MESCIFCRIANKEIASGIVYEDDDFIAFKDIKPVAPVHVLLIPKKHIENINSVNTAETIDFNVLFSVIQEITKELNINESGYRIVSNCGEDGGQTVGHLHFHIIGGRPLNWTF